MTKFGEIKSKIEKTGAELFGKSNFQKFMVGFKSNILENKDLSEIFYIYEDLSTKKGLDKDLANDYVNESIEYCQILLENSFQNSKKYSRMHSFSKELSVVTLHSKCTKALTFSECHVCMHACACVCVCVCVYVCVCVCVLLLGH